MAKCAIVSFVLDVYWYLIFRAFQAILKADCAQYGMDKDYGIGDAIASDWQQHIDDAVAGTVDVI